MFILIFVLPTPVVVAESAKVARRLLRVEALELGAVVAPNQKQSWVLAPQQLGQQFTVEYDAALRGPMVTTDASYRTLRT